jgi:hypothetical protein
MKKMMGVLDLQGALTALLLASSVVAHGGHEGIPDAAAVSEDPIVRVVSFALYYDSTSRVEIKRTNLALLNRMLYYGYI